MKKFILLTALVFGIGIASAATISTTSIPDKGSTDTVSHREFNTLVQTTQGIYHNDSGTLTSYVDDLFGFGFASPMVSMSLTGAVKIGATSAACGSSTAGAMRYVSASKSLEMCDGTTWNPVSMLPPCVPETCASLGSTYCGIQQDQCGGTIDCGGCAAGSYCNSLNRCVSASCNTNADCNDSNICTNDLCTNPGTASASCSHLNNTTTQSCTKTLGTCTNTGTETCSGGVLGACSATTPTITSWTPPTTDYCTGTTFTQTSNCGTTRSATGTKTCNCVAGSGKINNFGTYQVSGVTMGTLTWTWPTIPTGGYSAANTVSGSSTISNGSLLFKFGTAYCKDGVEVQYTGSPISTTVNCNTGYVASGTTCVPSCTATAPTALDCKFATCGETLSNCAGTYKCTSSLGLCPTGKECVSGSCVPVVVCLDTTWTPSTTLYCSGTTFTQTSNCGNTRTATGTKSCSTGGGGGCFVAGTSVEMADGTLASIEDITVGQAVLGTDGIANEVFDTKAYDYEGWMYSLNGSDYFVTETHPFMTREGWKSFSPNASEQEVGFGVVVGTLSEGDELLMRDGSYQKLETVARVWKKTPVFNISVSGEHGFYSDGYLVHNYKALDSLDTLK